MLVLTMLGKKITTDKPQLIKGNLQIIFTAPHHKEHRRPTLSGTLKQEEKYTDLIVKNLAEDIDSYALLAGDTTKYDPNYHKLNSNPFKKELKKVVEENQIKYLVDIHGMHEEKKYDIAIYYEKWFRNSRELAYTFADAMRSGELKKANIHILFFNNGTQETIATYASKELRIPAIQIEIAKYIRDDKKLRESLVKSIGEFTVKLKLL